MERIAIHEIFRRDRITNKYSLIESFKWIFRKSSCRHILFLTILLLNQNTMKCIEILLIQKCNVKWRYQEWLQQQSTDQSLSRLSRQAQVVVTVLSKIGHAYTPLLLDFKLFVSPFRSFNISHLTSGEIPLPSFRQVDGMLVISIFKSQGRSLSDLVCSIKEIFSYR